MIPVWDIWIRLFHWSFAGSVLFLLISGETGLAFFDWHRFFGEIVLGLVAFRILWGFVGSSNAKFQALFQSPKSAIRHLLHLTKREADQTRGHNAAGALAVLLMLLVVGAQAMTGLFIADEDELIEGAFYASVNSDFSNWMYSVHHYNAHLIQILVVVHVAMIFIYLLVARQNLINPMLTGQMKWSGSDKPPAFKLQHWSIGLFVALITAGSWWLLLNR